MVNLRRLLTRAAWNLAIFMAILVITNRLALVFPDWLMFSLIAVWLAGQVWYVIYADQKATARAHHASLENRIKNA